MIHKIVTGLKRHPKRFLLAFALGYTTLWALMEPISSILSVKLSDYLIHYIVAYFLLSLVIGIIAVWPKRKVSFKLHNTNTKVDIEFGDLFKSNGHRVIAVNEYFDSEIGDPVSIKSVHGIFIQKILGGHKNILDDAVTGQLSQANSININRPKGKTTKFELGTSITIDHDNTTYFLFALANSDDNCKATCSPELMLKALAGLWEKIRNKGNGHDVNMPLIGGGLSGIGLPSSQLLQLILISLLQFTKQKDINATIRIILLDDVFDSIDLQLIKYNWQ